MHHTFEMLINQVFYDLLRKLRACTDPELGACYLEAMDSLQRIEGANSLDDLKLEVSGVVRGL